MNETIKIILTALISLAFAVLIALIVINNVSQEHVDCFENGTYVHFNECNITASASTADTYSPILDWREPTELNIIQKIVRGFLLIGGICSILGLIYLSYITYLKK